MWKHHHIAQWQQWKLNDFAVIRSAHNLRLYANFAPRSARGFFTKCKHAVAIKNIKGRKRNFPDAPIVL
jgi:hypothetical protein